MSSIAVLIPLFLLFLLQNTQCNDLLLGYPDVSSKLIYSKVHQENPAIWVRSETFTVNCSTNEVINAIKIQDLRSDKWGDAFIKSGGIGEQSVTIELDSPTVFRGYNFWVEVYAIEMNMFLNNHGR